MSDNVSGFAVASHRGPYSVEFDTRTAARLVGDSADGALFLVDARIAELYPGVVSAIDPARLVTITATERNKSLDRMPELAEAFLKKGLRRKTRLVAVGGGITQDVACFLASILMRGVAWKFYPTTLLAQADSCIGSKSSINVGSVKNSAGTFWPPESVVIDRSFLRTLPDVELRSGVGEMIKVHAIDGPQAFDVLDAEYEELFTDPGVLEGAIRRSLEIKRRIIEIDEFDSGPRQVLNYGHTFGHAIESATGYAVPHGIAVTIGVDMANYVAVALGRLPATERARMRRIVQLNARGFEATQIPFDAFATALKGDKKAAASAITAILPDANSVPTRVSLPLDDRFFEPCRRYLAEERGAR